MGALPAPHMVLCTTVARRLVRPIIHPRHDASHFGDYSRHREGRQRYDRRVSTEVDSLQAAVAKSIGWFGSLYERFAHLIHEVGKFGIVGAICYGIDVAIFAFCRKALEMPWFPALVISTVIAA